MNSSRTLPPEHIQAGMPYPEAGQSIVTVSWGENGNDWTHVLVVELSSYGDPIVVRPDGQKVVLSDPMEWGWP